MPASERAADREDEENEDDRRARAFATGRRAGMHRLPGGDDPAQELQRHRRGTRARRVHATSDERHRARIFAPAGGGDAGQRHRTPRRARRRHESAVQRTPGHQSGDRRMDRRSLGRGGRRRVHLRDWRIQHEGGRRGLLLRRAHAGRIRPAARGRRDPDLRRGRAAGRRRHGTGDRAGRARRLLRERGAHRSRRADPARGRVQLRDRARRHHPARLQARGGGRRGRGGGGAGAAHQRHHVLQRGERPPSFRQPGERRHPARFPLAGIP